MSKEKKGIVKRQESVALAPVKPINLEKAERVGKYFMESKMYPHIKSVAGFIVVIMTGHGLGFDEAQSMSCISIVNGKPCIETKGLLAVAHRRGNVTWDITKINDEGCWMTFHRPGFKDMEVSFTKADASKAGLLQKQNWMQWTQDMYYSKCAGRGARRIAPDTIVSAPYAKEEVEDFEEMDSEPSEKSPPTESYEPIEAEVVEEKVDDKKADKALEKMGIKPEPRVPTPAEEELPFIEPSPVGITPEEEGQNEPSPATMKETPEEEELPFDQEAENLDHKALAQRLNKELGMAGLNAKELADFKTWLTVYQDARKPKRKYIGVGKDMKPHFMLGVLKDMKQLDKNLQVAMDTWRRDTGG